jgi:hypothetical protein
MKTCGEGTGREVGDFIKSRVVGADVGLCKLVALETCDVDLLVALDNGEG